MDAAEPAERLERLASLSGCRLSFIESAQVARALAATSAGGTGAFTPITLGILASSTVDQIGSAIRVAGLRRRLLIDVHIGPYGQYRQEVLDPTSALHRFEPHVVLFSLTARDAIARVSPASSLAEVEAAIVAAIDELRLLWRKMRESPGTSVIQQTFLDFADPLFGSFERFVPGAPAQFIATLNDRLAIAAQAEGVPILDLARASARDGLEAWYDESRWLQAKMEIAPPAAGAYAELFARILGAQRGLSRKCLVLDLDNTLWGGIIGDDGIEGIVLGEGSPLGEAHLRLQRYARQLRERGVILAVCSKNDPSIAETAFLDHPEMFLKRSDIAAFVANWDDKVVNLKRIASQLNIGLDSLVFVDDNPTERARVRQALPAVAVPELPADPGQYVRCVAQAGYFEAVAFTADDKQRAEQYAANASRDALQQTSESLDDFLLGLEMSAEFGPVQPVDMTRVAQLINKTNQFNPTTRRRTLDEVTAFVASERAIALQFRLLDRFGDNGLVSVMLLRPEAPSSEVFEIDTWVMSCRVFGRQLEREAMNAAVRATRGKGATTLRADYLPTAKNGVVSELYEKLGFAKVHEAPPGEGATRWTLRLEEYREFTTHIARGRA
jgi:FkbH-like protein